MIKENQRVLNGINVLSDGMIVLLALPLAYWVRFYVLSGGVISVPLGEYLVIALGLTMAHLFICASFGLYASFRNIPLMKELPKVWVACALDLTLLLSILFIRKDIHFSRLAMAIFFVLMAGALSVKRFLLRKILRRLRASGYNQKHVIILGNGVMANSYFDVILNNPELGYHAAGYVDHVVGKGDTDVTYLGTYDQLYEILEQYAPDEVVSAVEMADYQLTPQIIADCEKAGVKLSIIPFYASYMPSNPQFDDVGGIPLLNLRRIPLDNWANAAVKRMVDIVGSLLLILVSSPVMLVCAIGVKLSSPGPILFRQERVGLNKKPFYMYKFRSMRVNAKEKTGWSSDHDDRKTKFGAFIRKCSLDEFPQFFNVLKGDMSLVGPRPEVPYYVEQFKDDVPLYMVKHQVRPGITGWAQVNGFRGDTSIKGRIDHDIYYIEHWSLLLDIKILFMTVFGGKFMNSESLSK